MPLHVTCSKYYRLYFSDFPFYIHIPYKIDRAFVSTDVASVLIQLTLPSWSEVCKLRHVRQGDVGDLNAQVESSGNLPRVMRNIGEYVLQLFS